MGANIITVKLSNLSSAYGISNNTLSTNATINYAQLQINGTGVNNDEATVDYNGSISLELDTLSKDSLSDAEVNTWHISYQWYENNQQVISSDTSSSATFSNLVNNTTYYLVATYKNGSETYTWISNKITVKVNPAVSLTSPKIVYKTMENSMDGGAW